MAMTQPHQGGVSAEAFQCCHGDQVIFVYLKGSYDVIAARLAARQGHFMSVSLLQSQFEALEEPEKSENVLQVDIEQSPQEMVNFIKSKVVQVPKES